MKYILSIIALLMTFGGIYAQTTFDALRYSTFEYGGTARSVGVGSSMGALGADFTTLSTNPAGLASFRKSELTISTVFNSTQAETILLGGDDNSLLREQTTRLAFSNLGLVVASRPRASNWKTINFGIGFNNLANFYQDFNFVGTSEGSITDRFRQLADGLTAEQLDNFEAGLAFDVSAIFPDQNDPTLYYTDFAKGELVDKEQFVQAEGSINEMVISLAGNYDEKLMIGATLGIPFVNFRESKTYRETDEENNNPIFDRLEYREFLTTTGTGINLKLGFNYRPVQAFRIGGAIHTPTSFGIEENFSTSLEYDFDLNGSFFQEESQSPEGLFNYRLKTPWRVIGNTAFIYKKAGFITAEVEWLDYSSSSFNFNNSTNSDDLAYEQELNIQVAEDFQQALIVRVGGELAYKIFRFRGGVNVINSPYAGTDYTNMGYSAGVGLRERSFFLDLAFRQGASSSTYFPYLTGEDAVQPEVDTDLRERRFFVTLGFKF